MLEECACTCSTANTMTDSRTPVCVSAFTTTDITAIHTHDTHSRHTLMIDPAQSIPVQTQHTLCVCLCVCAFTCVSVCVCVWGGVGVCVGGCGCGCGCGCRCAGLYSASISLAFAPKNRYVRT